ncbi:nSTAND1 domain-containing NTPase [Streptomyces sp. NPDC002536]
MTDSGRAGRARLGRPERPVDPDAGPVEHLAWELRQLRERAGKPSYRVLARRAHYSVSTLAEAAKGEKLPSLPVVLAYAQACGGDAVEWEARWRAASAALPEDGGDGQGAQEKDARCPYPGLTAFAPQDADVYFGRTELVKELQLHVEQGPLVAVFGASGCGKSSLLRAGLLPGLGPQRHPVLLVPGARPLAALASAVASVVGGSPEPLHRRLAEDPAALGLALGTWLASRPEDERVVLVVDQFEEVFILCEDEGERAAFLGALAGLAHAGTPRIRTVLAVRADFYASCFSHADLVAALRSGVQMPVGPPSREELREIITGPAAAAGVSTEAGLTEAVVAEAAGQPGALPLVAHAMREVWQRRGGRVLRLADYRASGGMQGAVAQTAEHLYTTAPEEQQEVLQALFVRLTALGEGTEDTRRRVDRGELRGLAGPEVLDALLHRLAAARLVVLDGATVEVAHEAVIRAWPRLRRWLTDDRDALRTHRRLTTAARTWEDLGRDPGALYRGTQLATARSWARDRAGALNELESAFLQAGITADQRRVRRAQRAIAALSTLLALALISTAVAIWQRSDAVQQRADAEFRSVVAEADRTRMSDPSLSAQLALAAHRMRPEDQNVDDTLISTANMPLATPLRGHSGAVYLTSFSPDGHTLATASYDRTVRLWDLRDPAGPKPLGPPLTGHSSWLTSAVFSPDGKTLASAGDDRSVRLWNVADPAHPTPLGSPLMGGNGTVYLVAFSPDGHVLATADEDRTVRLWDLSDRLRPKPLGEPLTGHTAQVRSVAISRDGRLLAAGGDDDTVLVWNISDPARPERLGPPLTGHTGTVHSVAFSPDGRVLATGSDDKSIRLWDTGDPAHIAPLGTALIAHAAPVWSVNFGPDGLLLASAGADGTTRLWNVADPRRILQFGQPLAGSGGGMFTAVFSPDGHSLATGSDDGTALLWSLPADTLVGHTANVAGAAFSPDGHLLVTASDDRTARLWDTADPDRPKPAGRPLTGHTNYLSGAAWHPNGRILATSGEDGTARLWNVSDPSSPTPLGKPLTLHTRYSGPLAFSPNGHVLVTGSDDQSLQLWNIDDPAHPTPVGPPLTGHTGYINAIAFSPDASTLATASSDRTVRLWDVDDPTHPELLCDPLTGHTADVRAAAFSPDGHVLATAGNDKAIRLWNVRDPEHPKPLGSPLPGHREPVLSLAFSPDGRTLASSGNDTTVRLWDVSHPADGVPSRQLATGHTASVRTVVFSPDGRHMATASADNTARLWDLDLERSVRRICDASRGTLTPDQWKQHVPRQEYRAPCR